MEQQLGQKEGHMYMCHHLFILALSGVEEVSTKHYNFNLMDLSKVAQDNSEQFAPGSQLN